MGTMRILSKRLAILTGPHFVNDDIDIYSKNVTDHIFQLISECMPTKLQVYVLLKLHECIMNYEN